MRKFIFMAFVPMFFSLNVFSQQYYGDCRVTENLYYENFEDNRNGWDITNDDEVGQQIYNGKYFFQSKSNESKATWTTIKFDYERDFQVEALIKYKDGTKDNSYGLIWGKSTENNDMYTFLFSATGFYRIDKLVGGVFQPYVNWEESALVNKTDFNKLTVRKIGPMVYYYLNETYVFEHMAPKFFGYLFGFHVTNGATIAIDYLSISYIEKY